MFERLPPIMFHHFHSATETKYAAGSITADELEHIIRVVGRDNILDADVYARCRIEGTLLPQQTCFTFDDGLKCQYEVALPVLKRHNIRAAWHVYTCLHQERIPEQLEVYKYFQAQFYTDINDFYRDFFNKAEATYGERVQTALRSCASRTHASHASFYSVSDRQFRYIRDIILQPDEFFEIIVCMMNENSLTPSSLLQLLWMSAEQLRELVRLGHIVGLHSHTHNRNMDTAGADIQMLEYTRNYEQLCQLIHTDPILRSYSPTFMAHPLGKYRSDVTDRVLERLGIEVGFLAHDDGSSESCAPAYAIPRIDHTVLLDMINILPRESSVPSHM